METTRLYAPCVDTVHRSVLIQHPQSGVKMISRTARRRQHSPKVFKERGFVQRTQTSYFLYTEERGVTAIFRSQVTGHAVVVGSQGQGNGCRLKNAVCLRSVYDPVKDVTSDMGRLDNRLRKTEDVKDINHLGCARLIRAVKVEADIT